MYGSRAIRVICLSSAVFHAGISILQSMQDELYQGELIIAVLFLLMAELDYIAEQIRKK